MRLRHPPVAVSAQSMLVRASRGMGESGPRGGRSGSIDEIIERSKSHWSELADSGSTSTDDGVAADNLAAFEELQRHPSWGQFFKTFGYDTQVRYSSGMMEVGEKFAEGGQAKLFHAKITWRVPKYNEKDARERTEYVVKVIKGVTRLRDLQNQWPLGYLQWWAQDLEREKLGILHRYRFQCDVKYGTLLSDGRFAFVMEREHMDLRSYIDSWRLGCGDVHGPFQEEDAEVTMYVIALGMNSLHKHNVVHRDLKASNVLTSPIVDGRDVGKYTCYVADFECSIGVVGTGFWRAHEILQALKEKNINQKPELFSVKADAYSYAMTCYEVLTGKVPFEDELLKLNVGMMRDLVIENEIRPEVPNYVSVWIRDLLKKCWQSNPLARPSFEEILRIFETNSKTQDIQEWSLQRQVEELREANQAKELLEANEAKVSIPS